MFKKNRERLGVLLKNAKNSEKPLIFVIPGSGLCAMSSVAGGASFLVVLNSGIYRATGLTSHASFLPCGNANDQTEKLITSQILPRCPETPIVAGLLMNDSSCPLHERFKKLKEIGVAGIINWPPVSINNGNFMEALKKRGFCEENEANMLIEARQAGFLTFGFAASEKSVRLFVKSARVDALIINAGWTLYNFDSLQKQDRIQFSLHHANLLLEQAKKSTTGELPACLFYGGSISTVNDTFQLYQYTGVDGLGIGSALEFFPVKNMITGLLREYSNISRKKVDSNIQLDGKKIFIGTSESMVSLYRTVRRVANYDVDVCIEGESGSGKEMIAKSLHQLSKRKSGPFITVNCGSIPETLIESELFGHEKGAFTGALERRIGKFELADHGTLFLDEIAELSPKAQVSILRAIQQKEFTRVGGQKNINVDIRIITATHRCLKEMVAQEKFRADLYYRLNIISLLIPPLRNRTRDLPDLINFLLEKINCRFGRQVKGITAELAQKLLTHSWPGNIRELEHVLTNLALMEEGDFLHGYSFAPDRNIKNTSSVNPEIDEKVKITELLCETGGNKSKVARLLGISRKTLYNKFKLYGITDDRKAHVK